ncbi:unnamed protein product, partial [Symbiodinium microadriaticum]
MAISMSLLLRLAALTAFRLPQAAAELCGNSDFDLDTCVSTEEPCGQLPANTDHLTLIGYNTELECVVADLDSATWGICKSGNLTQSHGCTPSNETRRPTEFYIVLGCALVVHVVLLGLVMASSSDSGKSQKLQSGVFWWCHFWASLLGNVFVTSTSIAWGQFQGPMIVVPQLLGFLFATVAVGMVYRVPLSLVKKHRPEWWFTALWLAGIACISYGLVLSYSAVVVALVILGHWFVNGLIQLSLDTLIHILETAWKTWRA